MPQGGIVHLQTSCCWVRPGPTVRYAPRTGTTISFGSCLPFVSVISRAAKDGVPRYQCHC